MRVLGILTEQVSLQEIPIDGVKCGKGGNHGAEHAILQCCAAGAIETDGVDKEKRP